MASPVAAVKSRPDNGVFSERTLHAGRCNGRIVGWHGSSVEGHLQTALGGGHPAHRESHTFLGWEHPQLWVDIRRLDRPYRKIRRRTRLVGGHDLKDAPFPL